MTPPPAVIGPRLCWQGECMWLHLDLITRVVGITADIFPTVDYAYTSIPTYPSGGGIRHASDV